MNIDLNITFVEGSINNYTQVDQSISNLNAKELKKLRRKVNTIYDNTLSINLYAGIYSEYGKNLIITNSFFLNYLENEPMIFNDNKDYKGKAVTRSFKHECFEHTLGTKNPDPLFERIYNEPFSDEENIEDSRIFLEMPNEVKYPKYYNAYSLQQLNSNISVFGTIESIDGSFTTEKPIQGMKLILNKNGLDARERNVILENSTTLRDANSGKIESYTDEEYSGVIGNNDIMLQTAFQYTTRLINGRVYTVLEDTGSNLNSVPVLSNKIIFYTEDDHNIQPFNDVLLNEVNVADYRDDEITHSNGRNIDLTNGGQTDSIGFAGEID